METKINRQAFIDLLNHAISASEELRQLLKKEMQLLASREFDNLSTVLTHKVTIIDQLEELESQRSNFLINAGYSADVEGTQSFLADNKDNNELTNSWKELMDLVKECQVINQSNGMVVSKNQAQIQHAMQIITGGQNKGSSDTYNKNGVQSFSSSGRDLSKA
ncbi:MAG: flagellar protein FlgN [Gammaproteobacteria bacterium]|nr:MAG: flagellar protein FlgN [Gammaproteobacteria bacterium]